MTSWAVAIQGKACALRSNAYIDRDSGWQRVEWRVVRREQTADLSAALRSGFEMKIRRRVASSGESSC